MEEKKRRFVRTELRLLASMVKTPMGDYKLLLEQQKKSYPATFYLGVNRCETYHLFYLY